MGKKEGSGRIFFSAAGEQGITAGQVHHAAAPVFDAAEALCALHRFSGPVARMLLQSGQSVENRAFAHVGIARENEKGLSFPTRTVCTGEGGLAGRPHKDGFCLPAPQSNDGIPDQVSGRFAQRTSDDTADRGIFQKASGDEAPPERAF